MSLTFCYSNVGIADTISAPSRVLGLLCHLCAYLFLVGVPLFPTTNTCISLLVACLCCEHQLRLGEERAAGAPVSSPWSTTNNPGVATFQSVCSQWGQLYEMWPPLSTELPQDPAQATLHGLFWLLCPCLAPLSSTLVFSSWEYFLQNHFHALGVYSKFRPFPSLSWCLLSARLLCLLCTAQALPIRDLYI